MVGFEEQGKGHQSKMRAPPEDEKRQGNGFSPGASGREVALFTPWF